jgi:hypothetical protein
MAACIRARASARWPANQPLTAIPLNDGSRELQVWTFKIAVLAKRAFSSRQNAIPDLR